MAKVQKIMNKLYYDKEVGYHIGWANHWFGYFYSGYPVVLSFILSGIVFRYWGMVNKIIILCIIGIPILICYIPAYKAVFSNDIYLKYFKEFEKEDEQWHKKWKRRTWLFCIGGSLMTIVGIACMWVVLLMWSFRKRPLMPQFRSIIPCEVLLYIEVTFLGFIHWYGDFPGLLVLA